MNVSLGKKQAMKTLKGADLSGETKASKLSKIKQKGVFIHTYVRCCTKF